MRSMKWWGRVPRLTFCFFCPEILIILTLNLHFVCKVWWDNDICMWVEGICAICIIIIVYCLFFCISCFQCPIRTEFWWIHYRQEFSETQSKYKVGMLCLPLSKWEHGQLDILSIVSELTSNAERRKWT